MPTFASHLFGSSPFAGPSGLVPAPAPSGLPADLDAAIAARFAADPTLPRLATGGIFNGVASDSATMPRVVFKVGGGSPAYSSSTSRWVDRRLRFECFASTEAAALALARAVVACYGSADSSAGVPFDYADGLTTAPVLEGDSEVAERPRGVGNARVFRATLSYSVRARLGRPS